MGEINNNIKMLQSILHDPIANILLKYCNLTRIQFETILIDTIIENTVFMDFSYDNKKNFRLKKISRGSFRRTLQQARKNIISAVFTILLLYYIGFFEKVPLDDYLIISEQLKKYVEIINSSDSKDKDKIIFNLENELLEGIKRLSEPKSLKKL
ncbi:hypothetical protein KEJ21_01075 [Candidatus Bathyarchaeota archaeon]|nr:hypothetical protein [Candidatus Bathyarchaeota archaeon]MBS7630783.1 hypothetical protein [Candidatus Bathyarchaeota archaeon]